MATLLCYLSIHFSQITSLHDYTTKCHSCNIRHHRLQYQIPKTTAMKSNHYRPHNFSNWNNNSVKSRWACLPHNVVSVAKTLQNIISSWPPMIPVTRDDIHKSAGPTSRKYSSCTIAVFYRIFTLCSWISGTPKCRVLDKCQQRLIAIKTFSRLAAFGLISHKVPPISRHCRNYQFYLWVLVSHLLCFSRWIIF